MDAVFIAWMWFALSVITYISYALLYFWINRSTRRAEIKALIKQGKARAKGRRQ